MSNGLGRRTPEDWTHVDKYPFAAVAPETVATVERTLTLPYWHWNWDQGSEGACVGFGTSMMLTIINESEARLKALKPSTRRYNPWWLWDRAKENDEWDDTNPGDSNGTSVNAACWVLRNKGHRVFNRGLEKTEDQAQGISFYRWASTVDEMRTSIFDGMPVSIGVDWYSNFDNPVLLGRESWVGKDTSLGRVRGGHCVCVYAASDRRQAFKIKNSWGRGYPLTWIPYTTMQKLLDDDGEAALVTDK